MHLPFVIDNEQVKVADILNSLLAESAGCPLDIATAYFSVSGYQLVKEGLHGLGAFRLLLGAEPQTGSDVGLRPNAQAHLARLRGELESHPFTEETLRLVEGLIAFLRTGRVQVRLFEEGFLHAKAYIFHRDEIGPNNPNDRLRPYAVIVGSSNFTGPGLTRNKELNLVHRVFGQTEEAIDAEAAERICYLRSSRRIDDKTMFDPTGSDVLLDARTAIKSEVGGRAIIDLEHWFTHQWERSSDFCKGRSNCVALGGAIV